MLAFTCFHDIVLLVRNALDEITSQLCISNCLLVFFETDDNPINKEIISQSVLFQTLENETNNNLLDIDIKSPIDISPYLLETLFLKDVEVATGYICGANIPGYWLNYEILLEVCTSLGKNDGLSLEQLDDFSHILRLQEDVERGASLIDYENDAFQCLLNRMIRLLVLWCNRDGEQGCLGQLLAAFETVNLQSLSSQILAKVPIFVLRHDEHVQMRTSSGEDYQHLNS